MDSFADAFDARAFRSTVGRFVTGVTVMAMDVAGGVRGMTANSFTSLSLDPPLVLVCLGNATNATQSLASTSGFSINILSARQQDLSSYFAGSWKGLTPPPFAFTPWRGGPLLEGCCAAVGCAIHQLYDGGDHVIVVGRVIAIHHGEDDEPLVFYRGKYVGLDTRHPRAEQIPVLPEQT